MTTKTIKLKLTDREISELNLWINSYQDLGEGYEDCDKIMKGVINKWCEEMKNH